MVVVGNNGTRQEAAAGFKNTNQNILFYVCCDSKCTSIGSIVLINTNIGVF